jgi:hypothetical protein
MAEVSDKKPKTEAEKLAARKNNLLANRAYHERHVGIHQNEIKQIDAKIAEIEAALKSA